MAQIAQPEAHRPTEPVRPPAARVGKPEPERGTGAYAIDLRSDQRLARALGWFSIGLGVTEILMPRRLAKAIGAPKRWVVLLPLLGVREVASGLGILSQSTSPAWMRSRIAGDVVDLALLGSAMRSRRARQPRLVLATTAVAGVTALDILCADLLSRRAGATHAGAVRVKKSIAIQRPAQELYSFFRDVETLPRIMSHVRSVRRIDERRSHWVAKAPAGMSVEWDAEITEERDNERIAWRALEGSDVPNQGAVTFEELRGGRGTLVRVDLQYEPPAGQLGAAVASVFAQEPGQQLSSDLRRIKQLMETGEVATSEGPHGQRGPISRVLP